jgi:hypothetical protein
MPRAWDTYSRKGYSDDAMDTFLKRFSITCPPLVKPASSAPVLHSAVAQIAKLNESVARARDATAKRQVAMERSEAAMTALVKAVDEMCRVMGVRK